MLGEALTTMAQAQLADLRQVAELLAPAVRLGFGAAHPPPREAAPRRAGRRSRTPSLPPRRSRRPARGRTREAREAPRTPTLVEPRGRCSRSPRPPADASGRSPSRSPITPEGARPIGARWALTPRSQRRRDRTRERASPDRHHRRGRYVVSRSLARPSQPPQRGLAGLAAAPRPPTQGHPAAPDASAPPLAPATAARPQTADLLHAGALPTPDPTPPPIAPAAVAPPAADAAPPPPPPDPFTAFPARG